MRTEIPLPMENAAVICHGFRPRDGTTLNLVALYGGGRLVPAVQIAAANGRMALVRFSKVELVTNSMHRFLANGCEDDPELAFDKEMLECIFGSDLQKAHEVIAGISKDGRKCCFILVPEGRSLRGSGSGAEPLGHAEILFRDVAWLLEDAARGFSCIARA